MFDEPSRSRSRLPESPRINALLSELMDSAPAMAPLSAPETPPVPRSVPAQPLAAFLASVRWKYVPAPSSLVAFTPGMPVREFFATVNWPGGASTMPGAIDGPAGPPSVENLMSQFSWD